MSPYFSLLDLVVFFLVIGILAGIWTYNLYIPKSRPWEPVSPSGQDVPIWAVTLSMSSCLMPTLVIVGLIVEVYLRGTELLFLFVSFSVVTLVTAHCYIPVLFLSGVKSSFEYIGRRFGSHVRRTFAFLILIQNVFFVPFVLTTPLIIFQHVTTVNVWRSLIIFSTLLLPPVFFNNIRASVVNDALTLFLTVVTLMMVTSFEATDVGFFQSWNISSMGTRTFLPKLIEDGHKSCSLWSIIIGGSIMGCCMSTFNPAVADRYLAIVNQRRSQLSTWLSLPCIGIVFITCITCGIIGFAVHQQNCESIPWFYKEQIHMEEILPYMMSKYERIGLAGLFTAAIVSGTIGFAGNLLSTTAETAVEEIVRPFKSFKEDYKKILQWIIELFLTSLCIYLVTIVLETFNSTMKIGLSIFNIIGTPLLGIFTMGLFIPWTNNLGVFCSLIVGLAMAIWLTVGRFMNDNFFTVTASMLMKQCQSFNSSVASDSPVSNALVGPMTLDLRSSYFVVFHIMIMYLSSLGIADISYFWISPVVFASTVITGLLISIFTGRNDPDELDTTLLYPGISYLIRNLQIPCNLRKKRSVFICSSEDKKFHSKVRRISNPIIYV